MRFRSRAGAAAALLVASAIAASQPDPRVTRESAYRANNRGVALLERFDYKAAADAFRAALAIDPSLSLARINLSIALLYVPDVQNAEREATVAARELPDAPQPVYVLGLAARAQNRLDTAIAAFERVQRLDPDDVGSAISLGQIYLLQRRYADAIRAFRAAMAEEPYNVTAVYNLGLALTRAGERDEGQKAMERSQTLRASGYGTTFSTNYLDQGKYAEAIASSGAERDLVDRAVPAVRFEPSPIAAPAPRDALPSSPFGRRFDSADLSPDGARRIAEGLGGGITLVDVDGDGDLDLVAVSASGQRLFRNENGRFVDVTQESGLGAVPPDSVPIGCVAGDYDNDGRPDLFVLRFGTSSLYHNDGHGHFSDVTARAGLPRYPFLAASAALVDVDHDGDLDLVIVGLADVSAARTQANTRALIFPQEFPGAPIQLLRNNGNGTFTDITHDARVERTMHAVAVVPTDYDNHRDVDLLVAAYDGPPALFKNLRDGTFRDAAAEAKLEAPDATSAFVTSAAAADVNKDEYPDFFFGRADAPGWLALSDGRGRFRTTLAPAATRAAIAAQFIDYDNDGLMDLLTWSADGPHLVRNLGGGDWQDVTASVFGADSRQHSISSSRVLASGDLDDDGDLDLVANDSTIPLALWRNQGGNRHPSVRVRLKGRVSNRSAVGTKVQLRAGSLSERVETSAATPAGAAADVLFGLGDRAGADLVRVLWPSGVLQAETSGANERDERATAFLPSRLSIEELDRKPSSCPFLYTWSGRGFEFVTDFMGGGELGYWEAPNVRNVPDPIEYVRIGGEQLRPKDGRYDLRITNELEEAVFVDRVRLLSIVHPPDLEIWPNEGMVDPPKPFRLFAVSGTRPPARAVDDRGHDETDRVARLDRAYAGDFDLLPFRGYAVEHALTIDLGEPLVRPVLLLTGWTDYAFSSDNVAASQAGLALHPPALQVEDGAGGWRTAIGDIGIPVGRPQTLPIDLSSLLPPGIHRVRIVTNMRIYWDRIAVGTAEPSTKLVNVALDPVSAELRWRGFSAEIDAAGHAPLTYDYNHVTEQSPWKVMPGRYTREGDVRTLLTRADDMFVIAKPGDEIAVSFDAGAAGPLPGGWTRTFLLLADGFSKEMDVNSASPDYVLPLPFHGMTRYPYAAPEHSPDNPAHRRYQAEYNTRIVAAPLPTLFDRIATPRRER